MLIFLKARIPLFCFLLLYILFSSFKSKDYGISWDEYIVYMGGYWLYQDVGGSPQAILREDSAAPGSPHYDHLYPMVLYALNQKLSIGNFHFFNMVFGATGFWVAFEAVLPSCGNPWFALAGPFFLALNPRFFGELANNPKDAPFALFYFMGLWLAYLWRRSRKIWHFLVFGLVMGAASCVRLVGLSLLPIYVFFEVFERTRGDESMKKWAGFLAWRSFLVGSVAFLILWVTWPFLREDFFDHGLRVLRLSSNFPWNGLVLFDGKYTPATQLGWSYLPVWFFITTPLFILIFSAIGLGWWPRKEPCSLGTFLSFVLVLHSSVYLVFKPALYDGLRHYLFLEPVLSVLACLTFLDIFKASGKTRWFWGTSLGVNLIVVIWHMVSLHPYEYTYFNEVIGGLRGAAGRFETEYSGSSYKEAVEWLKVHETQTPRRIYRINTEGSAFQCGHYFTPNMQWAYFPDADYYIANGRWELEKKAEPRKPIYVVSREGVPFTYVFKLR